MLTQYGGFPAFEIMYDAGGHLVDATAESEAAQYLGTGDGRAVTDLLVISHGWNNDIAEARALYGAFFNALRQVRPAVALPNRSFGVIALFWPSKRFADPAQIPGGAAGLDSGVAGLGAQLDHIALMFDADPAVSAKIAHAKSLLPLLAQSMTAQDDYVATLTSLTPLPRYETDEGLDDARIHIAQTPGHVILQRLATPFVPVTPPKPGTGGAAALGTAAPRSEWGAAAGLGGLLGGVVSAAANLGDLLTYYTMKDRSGIVGRTGGVATITRLQSCRGAREPNVHLIGHSFGGRLVTSIANALPAGAAVASLTLLEAAYSHNGIAQNWDQQQHDGSFRAVLSGKKVAGPILITHSEHDTAVGVAYPIASRAMNQAASALVGGPTDIYGGMGRNGAQHTPEVADGPRHDFLLQPVGGTYPALDLATTWVRNLNGDGPEPLPTIAGHGDVAKPEIAYAFLHHMKNA